MMTRGDARDPVERRDSDRHHERVRPAPAGREPCSDDQHGG
jgi:hypothetical protein